MLSSPTATQAADDAIFFFVSRVIVAIFFSFSCLSFSISSSERKEKDLSDGERERWGKNSIISHSEVFFSL
jgi:hypothetical protein